MMKGSHLVDEITRHPVVVLLTTFAVLATLIALGIALAPGGGDSSKSGNNDSISTSESIITTTETTSKKLIDDLDTEAIVDQQEDTNKLQLEDNKVEPESPKRIQLREIGIFDSIGSEFRRGSVGLEGEEEILFLKAYCSKQASSAEFKLDRKYNNLNAKVGRRLKSY